MSSVSLQQGNNLICFITKILIMSNSYKNSSALLLSWVNFECEAQAACFYDFEQLKNSNFIYKLLQKIHGRYFSTLNHLAFEFPSYYACIENYLIEIEGKKFKRSFKKTIIGEESVEEIIKIVLYLLMESENKSDYISRIVNLSMDLQTFLMLQIKQIDNSLESFVDIKNIISAFSELQDENDEIKQRLKHYEDINNRLSQTIEESKQQNLKMEKEIMKYEQEKKQILEELMIADMKEYIQIYKNIKHENEEMVYYLQQIEERKQQIETDSRAMRNRINDDSLVIDNLNVEITNLRESYQLIKDQLTDLSFKPRSSFEDTVLHQNININNVKKERNSIGSNFLNRCSDLFNNWEDEEDDENSKIRNYNNDIMQKLEHSYKIITELTRDSTTLRDDNIKMAKKNAVLELKVKQLSKEQFRFLDQLSSIGFKISEFL